MPRLRSLVRPVVGTLALAAASFAPAPPAVAAPPVVAAARQCLASDGVLTRLDALKARHTVYGGDALQRAAAFYAATPPLGGRPDADHLIVADMPRGEVALLFMRGSSICATMMIAEPKVAAMARQFILGIEV